MAKQIEVKYQTQKILGLMITQLYTSTVLHMHMIAYQCSSKVKPSMLMVEVSLGCMVTVVGKLIVLHQKCQISQLALKQFW